MGEQPKILIVDDRPENLFAMRALLSQLDVEIIEANNGNEALMHTLNHEFALCLLDVQMPDMDGFEVAELLRLSEKTRNISVIFVTAKHQTVHDQIRGYEAGAVDYILKPIDENVFFNKVGTLLKLYHEQQRNERQRAALEEEVRQRTEVEKELRTIKDELEVMVEERTAELRTSNHELVRRVRESMKAVATLNLFRELVDRAEEAIVVTDVDDGHILDTNRAMSRASGFTRDDLRSMSITEVGAEMPQLNNWEAFVDRLEEGSVTAVGELKPQQGANLAATWKFDLIRRGGGQYIAVTVRLHEGHEQEGEIESTPANEEVTDTLEKLDQSTVFLSDTFDRLSEYVSLVDELMVAARDAAIDKHLVKSIEHQRPPVETLRQLLKLVKKGHRNVADFTQSRHE